MRKLSVLLSLVFGLVLTGCVSIPTPNVPPPPAPPSITSAAPAAGTVGVAYTTSLTATNGTQPYSWSITAGTLPAGLTLSGNTISGTPTTAGTSSFTVQVKDAANLTATANLSITITAATIS